MRSGNKCRFEVKWFLILSSVFFFVFVPWQMGQGAPIPTIEELTGGKLKVGDLVTKENVDLVKGLLSPGVYERVKRGMVMILKPPTPIELTIPKYFLEATEKNKGKAVIGKNNVVYTRDGKTWLGGYPFQDPQNGIEVMSNFRFGGQNSGADDMVAIDFRMDYIDKRGVCYKQAISSNWELVVFPRLHLPPLVANPSPNAESTRKMNVYTAPFDMKGLSLLSSRYYDDLAREDEGFVYVPALKRTRRISASVWQDSAGGTDMLWGDASAAGFQEPLALWDFKLLEKKFMLSTGYNHPITGKSRTGGFNEPGTLQQDVGVKFVRYYWELRPVFVVEAKPKTSHPYGKRVFYIDGYTYQVRLIDNYDRQMQLWKSFVNTMHSFKQGDIYYSAGIEGSQYDVQIDHMSHVCVQNGFVADKGVTLNDLTSKKMLELGR